MSFINDLNKTTSQTLTENGAVALSTTLDPVVDLFACLGALRERSEDEINRKFDLAYAVDPVLTTKMVFYSRDVRGGLGERSSSRVLLRRLANTNPKFVKDNMIYIPYFGRFDDLLCLFDTPVEADMCKFVYDALKADLDNMKHSRPISLCAKWMPSINTSNKETRMLAHRLKNAFSWSDAKYRKTLSSLRAYLNVTEVHMSNRAFDRIIYSMVPSNAMLKYREAFARRDHERFVEYLRSVASGTEKINAATLFPYDIAKPFIVSKLSQGCQSAVTNESLSVLRAQWNAQPNYVSGRNNFLVVADVSESMYSNNYTPISSSIALATYFAERNHGAFKNAFMIFSDEPVVVRLPDNSTIDQKLDYVMSQPIQYTTNLEAVFEAVLDTAVRTNCAQADMPKSIIVISDMEINDYSIKASNMNFVEEMRDRYANCGYALPNLVFWNVNSRHNVCHAYADEKNVQLVSGNSAATFKSLMSCLDMTPYQAMVNILSSERYECLIF